MKYFKNILVIAASIFCASIAHAENLKSDDGGLYDNFIKHPRVEKKSHSLTKISSPASLVREGNFSERFEVRPGDCSGEDCQSDRERFEVWSKRGIKPGTEGWYSWSFRLGDEFPFIRPANTTLGQFKQEPQGFEIVGIGVENEKLFFYNKLRLNNGDVRYNIDEPFMSLSQARGQWVDIMVHTNWLPDSSGFMEFYVNGKRRAKFEGPVSYNMKDRVTFRYGIYRSSISKYTKKTGQPVPTMEVFYDNIRSGKTRSAVELSR